MRWAILVVMLAPVAAAASPYGVSFDLHRPLDVANASTMACPSSELEVLENAQEIRFRELPARIDGLQAGLAHTGCAEMVFALDIPDGIDHLHVRGLIGRSVETQEMLRPIFHQRVAVQDAEGRPVWSHDLVDPSSEDREVGPVEPPLIANHLLQERMLLSWQFTEESHQAPATQEVAGTLRSPRIEFSDLAGSAYQVGGDSFASGDLLVEGRRIAIFIPEQLTSSYEVEPRMTFPARLGLSHVIAPDGSRIDELTSRYDNGYWGVGHGDILLERQQDLNLVRLGHNLIARHGPGEYVFYFATVVNQDTPTGTLALLTGASAMPLIAGAAIVTRHVSRDRGMPQAFQNTARPDLMAMVFVWVAALVFVIGTAAVAGTDLLRLHPLSPAGLAFYGLLMAALTALLFLNGRHERRRSTFLGQVVAHEKAEVESLEKSNRDLQAFAAMAGHDLKGPLRAIRGYIDLARRRLGEDVDEGAIEHLAQVATSAEHLDELVEELMAYSALDDVVVKATVDLNRAAERVQERLATEIQESKADIAIEKLPQVEANAVLIDQVLENLIGNAIKYRSESRPLQVTVKAEQRPGAWRIRVCDNGRGIPPAFQEHVFAPFRRHESGSIPGTGLGLALCKRIIDSHGGRMGLESGTTGSTFWFELPVAVEGVIRW